MAITEVITPDQTAEHSSDYMNGAIRCFSALSAMEKIVDVAGPEYEDSWLAKDAAINTLLAMTGKQSEFMRGVLTVLAEYVCFCSDCGTPDLRVWKPDAKMTAKELADDRQSKLDASN